MNDLVSIIVPCYNSERYIDRCIKSIISQKYKNFEVLIINDGSSDNSLQKLEHWEHLDSRIHVINQSNKGRSSARNVGLNESKGKYVTFIDSDDFVSSNYLLDLLRGLSHGEDVSMVGLTLMDSHGECIKGDRRRNRKLEIDNNKVALKKVLNQRPDVEVCGKMFLKSLFSNIKFPEGLIYEDFLVCINAICLSDTVSYIDAPDYFYIQRNDNTINRSFDLKKMDIIKIGHEVERIVCNTFPDLSVLVKSRLFAAYSNVWLQIGDDNFKESSDILWKEIIDCRNLILLKKITNKKVLIGTYLSLLGRKNYKLLYLFYKHQK